MNKLITYLLLLWITPLRGFTQEFLYGLPVNPDLATGSHQKNLLKNTVPGKKLHPLPFIDDFSGRSVYPDPERWADMDAYVNQTFAFDPPTIGTATLDAMDGNGYLYKHASTLTFGADTLTSAALKLGYADTLVLDSNNKPALSFIDFYYYHPLRASYYTLDSTYIREGLVYSVANDTNFYTLSDTLYYRTDTIYRYVYNYYSYDTLKYLGSFTNDTVIKDTLISELRLSNLDTLLIRITLTFIDSVIVQDTLTVTSARQIRDSLIIFNAHAYFALTDTFYYYSQGTYHAFLRGQAKRTPFTAADSIYLSFFYQPGGIIDQPESKDSLCLDFYSPSLNEWFKIWNARGDSNLSFRQVLIPIRDSRFLQDGFRFRFRNFASLSRDMSVPGERSNVDIWNIDYVRLNKRRNANDYLFKDVAYCEPIGSVLKEFYRMPYQHFLADYANQRKNTLPIVYRNLYSTGRAIRNFEFRDKNFNLLDTATEGDDFDLGGFEKVYLDASLDFGFNEPAFANDEWVLYYVIAYLKTDGDDINKYNDTLIHEQRFYNYYSYDDASAEAGYGLKGQGTKNSFVANRYKIYKTDSLQAIDILFIPSADTTLQETRFKLTVWNDKNGKPGSIIYQETSDDNKVHYLGLNRFYRYRLDYPFLLPAGVYYFGWEQTKEAFLNAGFDKNRDASSNLFYNLGDNTWRTTAFQGSLMLRPVVGSKAWADVSVKKIPAEPNTASWLVYPNPCSNILTIESSVTETENFFSVKLINMQGISVFETFTEQPVLKINTSAFAPGVYLLIINRSDGLHEMKRILIIH